MAECLEVANIHKKVEVDMIGIIPHQMQCAEVKCIKMIHIQQGSIQVVDRCMIVEEHHMADSTIWNRSLRMVACTVLQTCRQQ